MRCEWDEAKEAANRAKHGVSFASVASFEWRTAREVEDARYDYGERRWRAIGMIDGRLHVLVYTDRSDVIRVISLRKANAREEKAYARDRSSKTAG